MNSPAETRQSPVFKLNRTLARSGQCRILKNGTTQTGRLLSVREFHVVAIDAGKVVERAADADGADVQVDVLDRVVRAALDFGFPAATFLAAIEAEFKSARRALRSRRTVECQADGVTVFVFQDAAHGVEQRGTGQDVGRE